ncbi:MAG: hypothetical protein RBS09_08300 [Anaerolineaceae bacterium]|nr:hypothetical protein [Anaerolineaceae bacterium]
MPGRISTGVCVGRNETASIRYFYTSLAQARSDIHVVGGVRKNGAFRPTCYLTQRVPATKWMGIWTLARTKDIYPSQV